MDVYIASGPFCGKNQSLVNPAADMDNLKSPKAGTEIAKRSMVVEAFGLMALDLFSVKVMVDPEMTKPGHGTSDMKCRDLVL